MTTLIYATGNPAKLDWMKRELSPLDIRLLGLKDISFTPPEVDESGNDPLENAKIKALAYYKAIHTQTELKFPVFSCDSGLYIKGAPDYMQPGVHVRNVNGKRLDDGEMIEYYANIARQMGGKVFAGYRNGICLVVSEGEVYEYMGGDIASREFILTDRPHQKRVEGFPLDSLSVETASGKYYFDLDDDRIKDDYAEGGFAEFFRRSLGKR
ncbi:MAG: hypothetical protein FWF44_01350 [Defluviitaleaceae bacterium]|nr:hypothetical protein [Defluviitaleaceae bacterium]